MSAKKGTILKENESSSNQFSHPLKKEDMFPKKNVHLEPSKIFEITCQLTIHSGMNIRTLTFQDDSNTTSRPFLMPVQRKEKKPSLKREKKNCKSLESLITPT